MKTKRNAGGHRVTVVIRTKNSESTIAQALHALHGQSFQDFETLVVDSGSTDATLSIVARFPTRLIQIRPEEYFPGPVLNRAIAASEAPVIVFQNSDVVQLCPEALENLVRPILSDGADATYARQLPRPEAHTWVREDYARAFPPSGDAPEWLPYSLPFAAMRRACWEQRPFYDLAWGSEDTEWGRRARSDGLDVRYVPAAAVMHSHNYTLRQLYGRRFIEGEADAFIYGDGASVSQAILGLASSVVRDVAGHVRAHDIAGLVTAPARRGIFHWAYLKGRRHGSRRIAEGNRDAAIGQRVVLERYEG